MQLRAAPPRCARGCHRCHQPRTPNPPCVPHQAAPFDCFTLGDRRDPHPVSPGRVSPGGAVPWAKEQHCVPIHGGPPEAVIHRGQRAAGLCAGPTEHRGQPRRGCAGDGHVPEGTTASQEHKGSYLSCPDTDSKYAAKTLRVICDAQGSASISLFALESNPSPSLQDRNQQSPWQPRNEVPTPLLTATNPVWPGAGPP